MRFTADFETTTDPEDCRVWAYGICSIDEPDDIFLYGNNLDDFMLFCQDTDNYTLYFHNLKFDGEFILSWLFNHGYKHIIDKEDKAPHTFETLISDSGLFYSMTIYFDYQHNGKIVNKVTIYDSLKILPFSVDKIAKGWGIPEQKLEIDYKEYREVGHELTPEEVAYLKNDVVIVAKALKMLFDQNLDRMTQGSNALYHYKNTVGKAKFEKWFPIPDYDRQVRKSYRGGFTYLKPEYADMDVGKTIVLDVNSLYPSVMYFNKMPYGEGVFFNGKYRNDSVYDLYVQKIRCQFELKKDHIPTIQLKNNSAFMPNEYLVDSAGEDIVMTLTSTDLALFLDHYNVYNLEWLDGWKFKSTIGLFKDYIDYWIKIKIESTINGNKPMRQLAKLMLNALYGKFALNPNVRSKYPYMDEEGVIKYRLGQEEQRNPIYIPVGSFITAWARNKTIRSAQNVFDRFIYADTDSLHLLGTELPDNLEISDTELGAWAHEDTFDKSRYLRQKTYIEAKRVEKKGNSGIYDRIDGEMYELSVTCAGMPAGCYPYVTWDNFHPGERYGGKLQQKHVKGGIYFKDIDFTIKR